MSLPACPSSRPRFRAARRASRGAALATLLPGLLMAACVPTAGATPPDATGFAEIGRLADGPAGAVVLSGDIAWHARGSLLVAVDLVDPARPVTVARLDLGDNDDNDRGDAVCDLAARDGWILATVGDDLVVVDGRRPAHPRPVARLSLFPGGGWGGIRLELAGDALYCASGELVVVDVADPSRPRVTSRITDVYAGDVAAGGGRVFLAGHYGLVVLDAADPLAPVASETINEQMNYSGMIGVEVLGGTLFVKLRHGLETRADLLGGPGATSWSIPGLVYAAARHGDELLVSSWGDLAVHEPLSQWPRWIDESSRHAVGAIAVRGDLMVTTRGGAGLETWDLGAGPDPVRLAALGAVPVPGPMVAQGGRLYAACGFHGLQVFDVSHPRRPLYQGGHEDDDSVPPPDRYPAEFASPRGDLVLVGGILGLRLLDVSDPATPRLVQEVRAWPDGSRLRPMSAAALADGWLVSYGTGYRETPGSGLAMVRVPAPGVVAVTDVAPFGTWYGRIVSDGRLLYGWGPGGQLRVARVTPADSLVLVGAAPTGLERFNALAVGDGLAYVAGHREVKVVDVSDPARPRARGGTGPLSWYSNDGITGLAACGRMVFADFGAGLGLVDATDPDAPVGHPGWEPGARVGGLAAGPGEAYYTAGGGATLGVLRAHRAAAGGPQAPGVPDGPGDEGVTVAPNPCNPRATVSFTMAAAGPARVAVFDARGRRVRRLLDGELGAGPHSLDWAGDDDHGRAVAAGLYLVRVETPAGPRVARAAVVR